MSQKMRYIKIHSQINVNVTGGLQHLNMTDVNQNVGDKLKIQALWAKQMVRIAPGTSYYPEEIKNWKTVQALHKDGLITLGEIVDTLPDNIDELQLEFIKSNFTKLQDGVAEIKRQTESLKKVVKKTTPKETQVKLNDINL